MRAGLRDRRIVILRRTAARDSMGGVEVAYETLADVWAKVEFKSGGEVFESSSRKARRSAEFHILYLAGVDNMCRVRFDGEEYDVVSIDEPERRKTLVLHCVGGDVASGPGSV